jgi:hypothetical protein
MRIYWLEEDGYTYGRQLAETTLDRREASFATSFTVPSGQSPGSYEIAADCGAPTGHLSLDDTSETAILEVTEAPSPSSSPSGGPSQSSWLGPGTPSVIPPTTIRPDGPEPGTFDWVVPLGVAAALVALCVPLGRCISRARRRPTHSARLPVVRAVARPSGGGPVEPRRRGHGRAIAVAVVPHPDPGNRTIR